MHLLPRQVKYNREYVQRELARIQSGEREREKYEYYDREKKPAGIWGYALDQEQLGFPFRCKVTYFTFVKPSHRVFTHVDTGKRVLLLIPMEPCKFDFSYHLRHDLDPVSTHRIEDGWPFLIDSSINHSAVNLLNRELIILTACFDPATPFNELVNEAENGRVFW